MIERFIELLTAATARVPRHCFQLPVAGQENPIYRERVYCYELYHQLRKLLDEDGRFGEYALSGEINKQGHPIIRPSAPDFVFHIPHEMDNLAIIEVKPINAPPDEIEKDIEKLTYFVSPRVGYQIGIQLVYGDDDRAFARFENLYRTADLPPFSVPIIMRVPG